MTGDQQQIQAFVRREVALLARVASGPWLTQQTATQFRASAEHAAVSYMEERALTEAVAPVVGPANPALPFIVAGLQQVLDQETPQMVRLAHRHPAAAFVAACVVVIAIVKSIPSA